METTLYELLSIVLAVLSIFAIGIVSVVASLIMINNILNKPIREQNKEIKEQNKEIKEQVYNHIPTEIKKLSNKVTGLEKSFVQVINIIREIKDEKTSKAHLIVKASQLSKGM